MNTLHTRLKKCKPQLNPDLKLRHWISQCGEMRSLLVQRSDLSIFSQNHHSSLFQNCPCIMKEISAKITAFFFWRQETLVTTFYGRRLK